MLKEMSCHYTTVDDRYLEKWRLDHPDTEDPPRQISDDLLDSLIAGRSWVRLNQISMQL